ncbi:MAG: DUF4834 family protein [Alloprevotella sp.]
MNGFFGCLFILIFAAFFFVLGVVRMFYSLLFGGKSNPFNPFNQRRSRRTTFGGSPFGAGGTEQTFGDAPFGQSRTGNAHHEASSSQGRNRRSEKIFEKDEGTYVDFEEVK